MTQLTTSLVLTGDGSSLVAAVNRSETALDRLTRSSQTTSQGMKSARDSAAVFEAALNEQRGAVTTLATGYEQVARAGRVFEQQQATLKRALDTGTLDAREYDAALNILTRQHRQAAAAAELQANATGRLTTATKGGSGGLQNVSYQLQDIFTQISMGVPLLVSLGQQAPQLLSGFGKWGAVAGAASAAILPLTAAVFGLGYAGRDAASFADEFGESVDLLTGSVDTLRDAVEASRLSLFDLRLEYGENARAARELLGIQREIADLNAKAQLSEALSGLAEGLGLATHGTRGGTDRFTQKFLRDLQEEFSLTYSQANRVAEAIQAIDDAATLQDMTNATTSLRTLLLDATGGVENMDEETRDVYNSLIEVEKQALKISAVDMGPGIQAAADEATRMADALGAAFDNAERLANQGLNDLRMAQIDLQFKDDPVARAGARAAERFDTQVGSIPLGIEGVAINQDRSAYIRDARAAAEIRKQLADARRSGRAGTGGGSRPGDEHSRAIGAIERDFARLIPSYERDVEAIEAWRDESLAALDPTRAGYQSFADDVALIYDVKLADAYLRDLERRTDWAAGVERGLLKTQERMMSFADFSEDLVDKWSEGLEDAFVSLNRTGKLEIGDLVDYTADQFMRLAFQKTIQPGLDIGFDFLTGALGGLFGATQSHAGSTIGTGGVRRSYGPGAPLRADERLTVTTMGQRVFTPEQISNGATVVDALATAAQANQSGGSVVFAPQINVENQSSASVSGQMEETTDRSGQRSYKLVLADEVGQALARKGGGARQQMQRGYGLTKPGVKR